MLLGGSHIGVETPGTVKLLLPPQQSWGISYVCLETEVVDDKIHGLKVILRLKGDKLNLVEAKEKISLKLNQLAYHWDVETK